MSESADGTTATGIRRRDFLRLTAVTGAALAVRGIFAVEGRAESARFTPPPFEFEEATIDDLQKATFYTVSASGQGSPRFAWRLTPPQADPTCHHFSVVEGKPNEAVWHHADADGCNHNAMGPAGHLGTVTVTVKTAAWECTATFFGTNTSQGPPARRCRRL